MIDVKFMVDFKKYLADEHNLAYNTQHQYATIVFNKKTPTKDRYKSHTFHSAIQYFYKWMIEEQIHMYHPHNGWKHMFKQYLLEKGYSEITSTQYTAMIFPLKYQSSVGSKAHRAMKVFYEFMKVNKIGIFNETPEEKQVDLFSIVGNDYESESDTDEIAESEVIITGTEEIPMHVVAREYSQEEQILDAIKIIQNLNIEDAKKVRAISALL